jgi:hypothetical protein
MKPIDLARMNKQNLVEVKNNLVLDKMRLDKFFSVFLNENELDHDIPNTPQWQTYKEKLSVYQDLSKLINWADYYLGK